MSTYVYGFTHAAHPLPIDGMGGVGKSAPPLRLVRENGLAAVVSDAPDDLRAKRRDLETHQAILESLCAVGTVLPMRFGTVAPDDAAIRAELRSQAERYAQLLARLDGALEMNVKAIHREDDILRALLVEHRALREWNEALRASGGGSHEARVEFGEEIAAALEERGAHDAERVLAALQPHAADVNVGPPVDGCFVNASFLVQDTARAGFDAAVAQLRQDLGEVAELNVYGPLPPYSFMADGAADTAAGSEG
jgi:Gas vesicle synthesis protein GvpL/GvpF